MLAALANGFTVMADMGSGWRGHGEWLLQHDMTQAYAEYKQCLQVMAQRQPQSDFVLKCPDHLWFVDSLIKNFPDGHCLTHRDPVASIVSYCSLISLNWRLMYGRFDPVEIGRHIEDRFLIGIERAMAVRERVGEDMFLDVDFQTLCDDPVGVVGQITDNFGLSLISSDAIHGYLHKKRQDAKGLISTASSGMG